MTRKELIRLLPRDGTDLDAAKEVIALGYPVIGPALPEIMRFLRLADSPVADAFTEFVAEIGEAAIPAMAKALGRENCWLRHRVFCKILPRWPDASLGKLRNVLTLIATQPDAYDNDVRCIELLALRGLADPQWLRDWLNFKRARWEERKVLLHRAEKAIDNSKSNIG